jgi:ribose transport system substrate-binding protein
VKGSGRSRRALVVGCAAVAGLVALAACSSSSSGNSGSTTSGNSGSTTSNSSVTANVAAARSFIAPYLQRPTKVNVTPLPSKPKPGGTVAFMQPGTPQTGMVFQGLQQAAALVGWKTTAIPFDVTNQPSLNGALNSALSLSPKPVAVVIPGVPEVVWAKEIPKYQAAGVALIPYASIASVAGPVTTGVEGSLDSNLWGEILANWVISDSNGNGNVLLVNYPDSPGLNVISEEAAAVLKAKCPSCSVTQLNLPLEQMANGSNPAVVSELQSHPAIKYVLTVYGQPSLGLDVAIKTAGLTGITVAGANPSLEQIQGLASGTAGAWVANPFVALGYVIQDEALRISARLPIPTGDGGIPTFLMTKDNVGKGTVTDAAQEVPVNYPQLYAQAWKVQS